MSKGFHTVDLHACASAAIPTPAIGQNGNWYVGNDDTGVSANGTPGPKGDKGDTGDKGQDVDVSRIEQLEKDVSKLNSDLEASTVVSTAEHVVGTWLDGQPLYARTYMWTGTIGTLLGGTVSIPHNILSPKNLHIDSSDTYVHNGNSVIPPGHDWGNNWWSCYVDQTLITFYGNIANRFSDPVITVRYTK